MKKLDSILAETKLRTRPKNLSTEFQEYGVYLTEELGDLKHYALYIKLAQTYERGLLEEALTFTKDYSSAKSKGRVFMWKLKQLRENSKEHSADS